MQKGFASVLALLAVVFVLGLAAANNQNKQSFHTTLQQMVEAEQNNFWRSSLESNSDRIIRTTLKNQLQKGELNPETINRAIAQNLYSFFLEIEQQNPSIRFYWVEATHQSYERVLLLKTHALSAAKINEITKTIVVKQGPLLSGETVFTGGNNQNQVIIGQILAPHNADFFLIPHQHTTRVKVIA